MFQYLITSRNRRALHKEQIADRIWGDVSGKSLDQTFKVAVHGINKVLEPNRQKRTEPKYLQRQGATYRLDLSMIFLDAEEMEKLIKTANQLINTEPDKAQVAYTNALALYKGSYLPSRMYDDWTSLERERLQLMSLNAMISLSQLIVDTNPSESIRLCQTALQIDKTWEEAYRLQMQAFFNRGNRPMAIKTFQKCQAVLDEEFGIEPLPETLSLYQKIKNA